jgi:ABC-2 type transport system ATP-binding protein
MGSDRRRVSAIQPFEQSRARKPPEAPALEVAGLSFSYSGVPVLDEVEFAIAPGEFVVLLGPNGAGKTTLFSLITRLYDSRVGSIRIEGFDVRRRPSQALSRMGVVFQQPTLDLDLTVRQNLAYHAALHGLSRGLARERIEEQLRRLGMQERMRDKVRHLSGGQRRRIEIARALLHRPRLLLLDEPTVGLDIASRRGIVEHVHRLSAEDGVAVLWATHLIDEVQDTDTVIVLDRGRVRAKGTVAEVNAQAKTASIGAAFEALTEGLAA